jgi:hypothetical protein
MPGQAKQDIKLGFFVGIGLMLLMLLAAVIRAILGRVSG